MRPEGLFSCPYYLGPEQRCSGPFFTQTTAIAARVVSDINVTELLPIAGQKEVCGSTQMNQAATTSTAMAALAVFGVIVVATTIMGNLPLSLSGKIALRLIGVSMIGIGLWLA